MKQSNLNYQRVKLFKSDIDKANERVIALGKEASFTLEEAGKAFALTGMTASKVDKSTNELIEASK